MSQTSNAVQVPVFCLVDGLRVLTPLMQEYAERVLPSAPADPAAAEAAAREAGRENAAAWAARQALSDPDPPSGGATNPGCSQQTNDFSHVAATVDTSSEGGLQAMVKTVMLLPGFFQGDIQLPDAGPGVNADTMSISSIVAVVLLCRKDGRVRQLPLYRHSFVTTPRPGDRSRNHIFSFYPLLETDGFLSPSAVIEDCFGMRPQNDPRYMFSKESVRAVVAETFPDRDFPWLGYDSRSQTLDTNNSQALQDNITSSAAMFNALRASAHGLASGTAPVKSPASAPASKAHEDLAAAGLMPAWVAAGGSPPVLAEGWGSPAMPNRATVESFVCKLHLHGFLSKQQIAAQVEVGGTVPRADGPPSRPAQPQSARNIGRSIKDYLDAYRNAANTDVSLMPEDDVVGAAQALRPPGGEGAPTVGGGAADGTGLSAQAAQGLQARAADAAAALETPTGEVRGDASARAAIAGLVGDTRKALATDSTRPADDAGSPGADARQKLLDHTTRLIGNIESLVNHEETKESSFTSLESRQVTNQNIAQYLAALHDVLGALGQHSATRVIASPSAPSAEGGPNAWSPLTPFGPGQLAPPPATGGRLARAGKTRSRRPSGKARTHKANQLKAIGAY